MRKIELLAPAGEMNSLIAAVQNGANAVYIGGSRFSARAYAGNFNDEEIVKAVDYCHLYGVNVYVTLNTLLKHTEIHDALKYCEFLYNIGVDALIVQDTGLIYLVRKYLPEFELHASTQMTVHNAEGALFLKDLGLKRIVLSRELTLREIEYISKKFKIETEIFIHGALCISYSGQCLMSSIIGGRSGNRGRCAQPCRLPYKLVNLNNGLEKKGYLMSPKDICTINDVAKIIESGAASLKVEGRMKRPEYVAGVISAYRKAIDSFYDNSHFDVYEQQNRLMKLFNREGFSKAYLFGNTGASMMAYNFPKNTGIEIGKVLNNNYVQLFGNLAVKDGIRTESGGFTVNKIIRNGKEVYEAYEGENVIIKPSNYSKNEIIFKTYDYKLLNELYQSYKNMFDKKVAVTTNVLFKVDKPISLEAEYDGVTFKVEGDIVQKAINKPLNKERLIKNLNKAGDIFIKIESVNFEVFEEGFLPISAINDVRRKLLIKIENHIKNKFKRNKKIDIKNIVKTENENICDNFTQEKNMPQLLVVVNTEEQFRAALDEGVQDIAVTLFNKNGNINFHSEKEFNLYFKIPNIIKDYEFSEVSKIIEENINSINGLITANLGIINKFRGRTKIIGDYKLNIFNEYNFKFFNDILDGAYLSVELNKSEIKEIMKSCNNFSCGIIVYGKYEIMVSEYCVIGSVFGGKTEEKNCSGECTRGKFVLKDRMGKEFKLKTDKFCRCYIYNSVPTNLIDNIDELNRENLKSYRIDLIDENYEETICVIKSFKYKKWLGEKKEFTRGHFKRGVE
ncbi:putative protease YdcP precursor [Clostridium tepidiprofundi DSM 19306]|uniref:Putative protease YdcP n=1 Tax=Clostridium tepidiprofundi DSM 19306 TaxID=1121338 RepID=A0A151ATS7_9CLOT|nr:U32 family peptidase [Clostridium tepidiprofundi]KYH31059.1 putative protease YdcP precursor [Clostridium tepidiprofundi DSM 19306]